MRILRVAQKLYPEVKGGGAYHAHALSRDQASLGHDVTVLTVARDGESVGSADRSGYTVVRCPTALEPLGNSLSLCVARYLWMADDFDVVHAHSHLYFSTNIAALMRIVGKGPLAVTNHGLYSQSVPRWMFDVYLRTVGRLTFEAADVVFCYSPGERDRLRGLGVATPVSVVPNGIDVSRFTPGGPSSDIVDDDVPGVLFAGRLTDGKRPQDAVRAIALARQHHPDARLYVAGDGPCRPELESLVNEHGMAEAVTFLGHLDYDEMPAVYRSVDVLVLPSRSEGMPRTLMEALATATPVVTSDLPQLKPLTEKAGRAVPVGDVDALASAIVELLDDPDLASTLGARGRERVCQRHTWDATVRRTTDRLARLAREHRA